MKKVIILITIFCNVSAFSQWYEVSIPTTSGLNDVFFVNEDIGYLVGGGEYGFPNNTDGVILRTVDGGITWTNLYTQSQVSFNYVFVVANKILIYGRDAQNRSFLKQSIDNGISWSETLVNHRIDKMDFSDGIIYYLDNDGSNFLLKKIENENTITIANNALVFGVKNNEIIYVNDSFNSIFKSTDYGENWGQLEGYPMGYGNSQGTFSEIKSFNDTIIIHYTYPNTIAYSLDNGNTWTENMDDNDNGSFKVSIIGPNKIYGFNGFNNPEKIYINVNYLNWTEQIYLNNNIRKIYFYNNNLGFAIGENGTMYRTVNAGSLNVNSNDLLNDKIQIFPNPTKNIIKLEISQGLLIKKIQLYTIQGKLVKNYKKTVRELKVGNLSSGNYILKIKTGNGEVTKKIVIK